MRLDQAVAARYPDLSRRKARELISQRRVLVNERPVAVASREVQQSDRIVVLDALPQIEVLRETEDWIAVAKPAGQPAQPTRTRDTPSLEELLRVRSGTVFLIHRLDTPTSGVMIFAQNRPEAARLSHLFAAGEVRKLYLAIVGGSIDAERTIDSPIDGRNALTIVRPLGGSRVEVEIKTGRTHQIRIHLAAIGHPVAGDRRYGGPPAARLMLHAWKLSHPHFGELVAPPPPEFAGV
ncbi:MAG TPA: RluA family pseudouridine synthase [Thermoanaerobaculia bacterium]|nr:RluA family pseudouridine synthase [Thermoanaerobaculia bacterium]